MPVLMRGGCPRPLVAILGYVVLAVVSGACSGSAEGPATDSTLPASDVIAGTLVFPERTTLGADAVAEVELTDTSTDGSAAIISAQRIRSPGQLPVHFRLEYPPERIDPARRYAVQARILEGGRLVFTADVAAPVITQGNPRVVTVTLIQVGADADSSPSADESIVEGALEADGIRSTYAARFASGQLVSIQEERTVEDGGRAGAEYQFRDSTLVRYLELGLRNDPSGSPVRVELDIAFDDNGDLLAVRKSVNESPVQPTEDELAAVLDRVERLRDHTTSAWSSAFRCQPPLGTC